MMEHVLVSKWFFFFRDEYFRMKLQWKSVSEEQEKRNSRLRDYRSLIGKFGFRNMQLCELKPLQFNMKLKKCKLLSNLYGKKH